jgi:hypothetical protein
MMGILGRAILGLVVFVIAFFISFLGFGIFFALLYSFIGPHLKGHALEQGSFFIGLPTMIFALAFGAAAAFCVTRASKTGGNVSVDESRT